MQRHQLEGAIVDRHLHRVDFDIADGDFIEQIE
jgi:hypothetical protein